MKQIPQYLAVAAAAFMMLFPIVIAIASMVGSMPLFHDMPVMQQVGWLAVGTCSFVLGLLLLTENQL